MMQKLSGKIALITGGTSGIGLATAKLFREHGARVVVTGRDNERLSHVQQELGEGSLCVRSDAGKITDIESLMDQIRERFGALDVLFANACSAEAAPFEQLTEAQFDRTTATSFKGVFFMIQKALPLLRTGSSVLINTSISNQKAVHEPMVVYAANKAALRSLTMSLGHSLIGQGIRVNALSPGPIETPGLARTGLPAEEVQALYAHWRQRSPSKRMGTPEEVAKAALFLASADASYLVGVELVIDGGYSHLGLL